MSDEWAHRENCPNGSCIGLIGPDGTCKVCGRAAPNWGDERRRGMIEGEGDAVAAKADGIAIADEESHEDDEGEGEGGEDEVADDDDDDDDADEEDGDDEGEAPVVDEGAPAWSKRKLCSDGACVGVIGANGKCNVCGSAAA